MSQIYILRYYIFWIYSIQSGSQAGQDVVGVGQSGHQLLPLELFTILRGEVIAGMEAVVS